MAALPLLWFSTVSSTTSTTTSSTSYSNLFAQLSTEPPYGSRHAPTSTERWSICKERVPRSTTCLLVKLNFERRPLLWFTLPLLPCSGNHRYHRSSVSHFLSPNHIPTPLSFVLVRQNIAVVSFSRHCALGTSTATLGQLWRPQK